MCPGVPRKAITALLAMKKQFPLEEISTWVYNGCIKAQYFAWMSNIGIADTERNPSTSSNLLFSKFSVIYYFGIY